MRCPNCQTINPINAKFCLECGNRLLVCPNCGTVNLPIAKFCIECGTSLQALREQDTVPIQRIVEAEATQPVADLLLPSEERRVVTAMFADITGSTPLADRLDPEDMRAILTGYFNLMAEQIRMHEGTIEKYIGDAVMAIFGVPFTHEDDPDRAVRAALDMQKALASFNEQRLALDPGATRLQMRIGLNTGEVAIPANVQQRQDFLITGDAVNIAARLQQAATPDTILVGERTYLSTREVFEFQAIAPLHLKGKPEPIPAYVVSGLRSNTPAITQHPRGIEGRQAQMIGRSLELTLMHANYARVRAERHPHLITILGTPGIGKSRLVREFIAREQSKAQSVHSNEHNVAPKVLIGRCPPYGEGITYWPLIEISRSLLQVQENETNETLQQRFIEFVREALKKVASSESPEEIAGIILRSLGRNLSGTMQKQEREVAKPERRIGRRRARLKQSGTQVALLRAWRVLLEALAEAQPLIIVVDDLQWADEALLDLLEYLTDRITSVPILFLCPARPDFFERRRDWGGGRRNFTTIELESLSQEESSELIDELLNTDDLPDVLRYTILARAEGNPFFLEEIIRMFIDQGILVSEQEPASGKTFWHAGRYKNTLTELTTPGEHPDDSLINMHYVLPLPRVPDTIQGVLAARVDLLNPVEKLVLQYAAIIGRTFWLSSLLAMLPDLSLEMIQAALASLVQHDFIIETEKAVRSPVEQDLFFSFKHVLIRDVVYNNIPRGRRCEEHVRIALWLEDRTKDDRANYAELLAYHYQQALNSWSPGLAIRTVEVKDPAHPEAGYIHLTQPELRRRAISYLVMAGDQALQSYYTVRALQAYNDAYELLNESDMDSLSRINLLEKRGDAKFQRGNADEAWQEYHDALHLAIENNALSQDRLLALYWRLVELATRWQGMFNNPPDPQEVRGYIDAGLRLSEAKPAGHKRIAFLTFQAFWYTLQLDDAPSEQKVSLVKQAQASGQAALHLAEQLNNPLALSLTLDAMSFIQCEQHQYKAGLELQLRRQKLERSLTDREELYDLYMSLGHAYERTADYPTAMMWFGRAWTNAQTMENPGLLVKCLVGRMRAWRQWNRWDNAVEVAREVLRLIEQYQQDEKRQMWALETLATIAYRRGEQEQGDQYSRQYKRLLDQQTDEQARANWRTRLHSIHLSQEDWGQALIDYQEKLQLSEPTPSPEVLATLAELLVVKGEDSEAQAQICERAIALADEAGDRKSLLIALRAHGRMYLEQQSWKLAEDELRRALNLCEVLDLPWEQGNTLYYLGMLYKQRSSSSSEEKVNSRSADLSRARYHFELAADFFESLKAVPSVQRAHLALTQDLEVKV
ncbi:zinc-ribbon domain-containing protein [Ktedonosporobacter rubrisoli]|uniref:Zinc-ribbon domain-containing protein n=1 Tax=Ktedonosporobacter rubrisoli TaxID=2509675 RepID=A0A4P6K0V5_KTERU|nr:adenylate/guanylate cyclase domain-containing protein [Ktedonosporobacter rubrisoli]QBD81270.1 zinc-ribbon domain-containing protein [Ktedonosporobacter rubrisoli]